MNTEFKIVEGFDNYEVSNTGEVRNRTTGTTLKIKNGLVGLSENSKAVNRSVARLVWKAFKNDPLPSRIGTKDGDRNNAAVDNLVPFENGEYGVDVTMGEVCVDLPGEEWKDIPNFPNYQASNLGRIRSNLLQFSGRTSEEWRIKAPGTHQGYKFVALRKDGKTYVRRVHALVLKAFVGPRPTINGERACTRHLNGNPADNRLENLAWGTMKENAADKKRHGTENYRRGEDRPNAVLTEVQVLDYKERMAAGEWYVDIAKQDGLTPSVVYGVGVGKSWAHVEPGLDCTPGLGRKAVIPDAVVADIKNGMRPIDVADKYGVSVSGITRKFKRVVGVNPREFRKGVAA